jgi:uncharacterized protein involved in exopolysaccharide biosynthesis
VFANLFGLFWRRQWVLYLTLLLTFSAAFLYYAAVGERYEAYALLRVGQGIKERTSDGRLPFADGVDLQSRMESLARISKTDRVIQEAASQVGYDRLFPEAETTLMSKFRRAVLANFWAGGKEIGLPHASAKETATPDSGVDPAIERHKSAITKLRDRIVAKQEGRSNLLKVSFRHSDPVAAAQYLNKLANVLVAAQGALIQVPGAQEFFEELAKRQEQETERAAADLQKFSVKASIYAVDEQRALLLRRANELTSLISTTRGVIEERKGQKQALVDQLLVLRPVTQSHTVSRIVRTLGEQDLRRAPEGAPREPPGFEETPPLLLVKVYQDNIASLMKVNSDLSGSMKLLNHLGAELENVNKELASLSSKEAEYDRLKRIFGAASSAAAQYHSRMMEEQINTEVAKKAQLGSLRVIQQATAPTTPVFPEVRHLIGLALVGGILLGCAIVVGPELATGGLTPYRKQAIVVMRRPRERLEAAE